MKELAKMPEPLRLNRGYTSLEILALIMPSGIFVPKIGGNVDCSSYVTGKVQFGESSLAIGRGVVDSGTMPMRTDHLLGRHANTHHRQGSSAKQRGLFESFWGTSEYKSPNRLGNLGLTFIGQDGQAGVTTMDADLCN